MQDLCVVLLLLLLSFAAARRSQIVCAIQNNFLLVFTSTFFHHGEVIRKLARLETDQVLVFKSAWVHCSLLPKLSCLLLLCSRALQYETIFLTKSAISLRVGNLALYGDGKTQMTVQQAQDKAFGIVIGYDSDIQKTSPDSEQQVN